MASLQSRLGSLITAIGADINDIYASLATKLGVGDAVTLADPTNDQLASVTIQADGSATSGWKNRLEFLYQPVAGSPTLTGYFNEYGELRIVPGKSNTIPMRLFTKTASGDTDHSVNMIEIMDDRGSRNLIWGIDTDGYPVLGPNAVVGAHVIVLGAADSVPTGTPVGTVILRTP